MASDAPTAFSNVRDTDIRDGKACYDTQQQSVIGNLRLLYELLASGSAYAGESRQVWPHTHGDLAGSAFDGEFVGRSIYSKNFRASTTNGAAYTLAATTWTELLRFRARVGAVRRLACELRYLVSTAGVKFRIERWDWNDSSAATDDGGTIGTQYLVDSSSQTATSASWHTIDGTSYTSDGGGGYTTNNGGADTKLLYLDEGTYSTPDEDRNLAEFVLRGYASSGLTLTLLGIDLFEVKTTDEGASGLLE